MINPIHILTFDIEEWFNLLDFDETRSVSNWDKFECRIFKNTDRILELLRKKNQKATFFCIGWVAQKYPELIKKIDEAGYEIGSHSCYHQLAYELTPKEFGEDLKKSIDLLQNITGKKITNYRVPGFSITRKNAWAIEMLIDNGITGDSSIFPAPRGHGGFADFGTDQPVIIKTSKGDLKEYPINTASFLGKQIIFSGGGYFRLLPYFLISKFMNRSPYVMTYFHPRDFDADQPILKGLSAGRRFKSYYGLSGALGKLEKLLDNYSFMDIQTAEKMITWNTLDFSELQKSEYN